MVNKKICLNDVKGVEFTF